MVLLDQPLCPWFARSKVPELPLGRETSLVTSTGSGVPDDISRHLWVGLEPRWGTISQFGSIYSPSGPTAVLHSPERLVPQPPWGIPALRAEQRGLSSMWCSATSVRVPLPCAGHNEGEWPGAEPAPGIMAGEPIPPNKCYPLQSLCIVFRPAV